MNPAIRLLPPLNVDRDPHTGLDLSYRIAGRVDGRTLVFLHGFNGGSASWAWQFAHFAAKARVISIDFPGYGRSSVGVCGMEQVADRISRLLQSLNVRAAILVGHSMGGMLAQVLACHHGDQIAGVVLSCTHTGYGLPADAPLGENYACRIEERQRLNDRDFGALRVAGMVPDLKDRTIATFLEEIAGAITVEAIRCGGTAMQQLDTSGMLSGLTWPCLIITAELDRVVAAEKADDLRRALPDARHVQLAGVGHAPYCEDAEAFNRAIDKFVATLSLRG